MLDFGAVQADTQLSVIYVYSCIIDLEASELDKGGLLIRRPDKFLEQLAHKSSARPLALRARFPSGRRYLE